MARIVAAIMPLVRRRLLIIMSRYRITIVVLMPAPFLRFCNGVTAHLAAHRVRNGYQSMVTTSEDAMNQHMQADEDADQLIHGR